MELTTALTGMLPFIVLVSAVLTALASALLLWLYRRAVVRSMSAGTGSSSPVSQTSAPLVTSGTPGLTITTVGAGDPVSGAVEPHEFLDFVGGRLSRQFIESEADMNQRLDRRDLHPDPDGRYRVNEFFCRQDTWQMTMRRLAADSDAVLMNLRSFSPRNHGCLWELEQLLIGTPLDRVLFVVDETTDQTFLEEQLQALWVRVSADSPNRGHQSPVVRLFWTPSSMSPAADSLVKRLFDVCIPATA